MANPADITHAVPDWGVGLAFVLSFGFGGLVGVSELLSRYKSDPMRAIEQTPALVYIAVNAVASASALWLMRYMGWLADAGGGDAGKTLLIQTLVAAFGAMAFFRTSLFTVRVSGADLQVGPAAFLQVILASADRGCDRQLAGPRARAVAEIMSNISFDKAKQALPALCFSLMQNVQPDEQQAFGSNVKNLEDSQMEPGFKAHTLGLNLMNVVGEKVLREAVSVLRQSISEPVRPVVQSIATLRLLRNVKFASGGQIVDQCLLVSGQYQLRRPDVRPRAWFRWGPRRPAKPASLSAVTNRASLGALVDAIGAMNVSENNKVLYLALSMINLFGEEILQRVLQALPENENLTPLTPSSSVAPPPPPSAPPAAPAPPPANPPPAGSPSPSAPP